MTADSDAKGNEVSPTSPTVGRHICHTTNRKGTVYECWNPDCSHYAGFGASPLARIEIDANGELACPNCGTPVSAGFPGTHWNTPPIGELAGGAVLGLFIGGAPGAILGGVIGALLATPHILGGRAAASPRKADQTIRT